MTTLTDLRQTLGDHAETVVDTESTTRVAAVQHRVAAVRRRRRVAGTGALAAAVVAGSALVAWPHGDHAPAPAGPVVLGEQAPGSIRSLGYTYDATGRSQVVRDSGKVRLAASDTPRLLSWTLRDVTTARFTLPGPEVHTTTATHFGDFLYVPAGQAETVAVKVAGGSAGIASYVLSDRETPAGYTHDGVTYRSEVARTPLLSARIVDGATSVSASYVAPDGPVDVRLMCTSLPKGYALNVSFNGHPGFSYGGGACDSDGTFDPGASGYSELQQGTPGRTMIVRAWVSRSMHDATEVPASELPGLRLGVGVYGPVDVVHVGGFQVPRFVEYLGHTWGIGNTVGLPRPTGTPTFNVGPAPTDRIAALAWNTRDGATISFTAGAVSESTSSRIGGQGSTGTLWVPAHQPVHLRLTRGQGTFGIAFYDPVD
jgi:hypothetical protein